jgi:FixJ family two-component response regulator
MEPRISIVEDDQSVRAALQRILVSHGFAPAVFSSAEQFLASDQATRAACLIADVRMPGMSGLRLHEHLVAAGNRIPTILITGAPTIADRETALAAGVVSYLAKPFSEQGLLDDIAVALGRSAPVSEPIDQSEERASSAPSAGDAHF